jgi:hypothetical protein
MPVIVIAIVVVTAAVCLFAPAMVTRVLAQVATSTDEAGSTTPLVSAPVETSSVSTSIWRNDESCLSVFIMTQPFKSANALGESANR